MYRHLLLPTDGSELSVRAFTAGIAFAKTLGARVTGLSVVPEHQVAEGLGEAMVGISVSAMPEADKIAGRGW